MKGSVHELLSVASSGDQAAGGSIDMTEKGEVRKQAMASRSGFVSTLQKMSRVRYPAAFLTQLQVLSGREWKILRRYVRLIN